MARKKRLKELVDIIVYAMVACLQFFLLMPNACITCLPQKTLFARPA